MKRIKPIIGKSKKLSKFTICKTSYCRNRSNGRQFCSTCRSRKTRKADEVRHAFNNLKSSAKRRGIEFTIDLPYFRRFAYKYKFYKNVCHSGESWSVDRIDNTKGYIPGNIQALPVWMNASKGKRILSYDWYHKTAKYY